ncbi:glycerol-3-phosphate O-acyltransferase [Candidatus Magnetomoraceae bacterium gMMP-15]
MKLGFIKKLNKKLTGFIDKKLKGTHNHYTCHLPNNIGTVSNWILKLFYSGITVDNKQTDFLRHSDEKSIIVYASKYKSFFDFMFFYSRYKKDELPYPEIGLDYKIYVWQPVSRLLRIILGHFDHLFKKRRFPNPYKSNYIKKQLIEGRSAFLSLVEPKGFYRRFVKDRIDPIHYLIEIQRTIDIPIYIVPQWIFFSRKPHRTQRTFFEVLFGTEENPGDVRRLVRLFRHPEKVFVEISEPFNLLDFIRHPKNKNKNIDDLSFYMRREIIDRLNRHRQSITGPVHKSSEELKEIILSNERLRDFIYHHAKIKKISIQSVYRKSSSYIDEISAKINNGLIQIFSWFVSWISNNMFEGVSVDEDGLNKLKQASQKAPLILVPCHKSHIDYLILSYVLYHNNMPCPLTAAGKNLSFWPLGPLFRNSGAFFIRRTFRGAILYSKVFAEYIRTILHEGHNIEFFIEGGRSRTGKLILPKLGLLSIILDAYKTGACPDLIFVPIFIGYDRVLEENAYLSEIEGGKKEPENISQVVKAGRFLKKRYGRIYLRFNDPISLKNDVLPGFDTSIQKMSSKERNLLCRNLGHRIINAINNVSIVTPHALVASALLNGPVKGFMKSDVALRVETYLNYLIFQNAKLSDTMINYVNSVEHALESYLNRKLIEKMDVSSIREAFGDTRFIVNENKRHNLEYYKNNSINFFIPPAITALIIISHDVFQFSENDLYKPYEFLRDFFQNDFAYDVEKTTQDYVSTTLKAFLNDAIIMPHPQFPDTYNVTSVGFKKLGYFAVFLKTYFESYMIALNVFMEHERKALNAKERIKKIQTIGNLMYKNKEITRKESLSKITCQNASDYFKAHGIRGSENKEKIEFYSSEIRKYLKALSG